LRRGECLTSGRTSAKRREDPHWLPTCYEQCVANGVAILKPLAVTAWGTKGFYIEDPDGNIISFGGSPATETLEPDKNSD
jgi:catechol 2,3-dioxygenase-like lactoylglutathione lyase family enzyme